MEHSAHGVYDALYEWSRDSTLIRWWSRLVPPEGQDFYYDTNTTDLLPILVYFVKWHVYY